MLVRKGELIEQKPPLWFIFNNYIHINVEFHYFHS